jgi:hydrogenase expression/formation protein HypE
MTAMQEHDQPTRSATPDWATCPLPVSTFEHILLGHGSGGRLTAELVCRLFVPAFENPVLSALEDQAVVSVPGVTGTDGSRLAFTTDSFVVRPIFFPGGDIGRLAICGTVNDLAVGGAQPLYVAAAFILEEGLPLSDLRRLTESMRLACDEAAVTLVAGDTKVVDRGKGDQVFITTSAVGLVPPGRNLSIRNARPGDQVLISGTIGDHGVAILSAREGLEFETTLESDCAPLAGLAQTLLETCPAVRLMRDPTRGGVSSALNELAAASQVGVQLWEDRLPIRPEVQAACEILGLDPLYVANEGKLLAVVPAEHAERAVAALRSHPLGQAAEIIGQVLADHPGMVTLRSRIGGQRIVTMLAGEQLPRIC